MASIADFRSSGSRGHRCAALVAAMWLGACLLPGEPSDAERVVFVLDFPQPYRAPLGAVVHPPIKVSQRGEVLQVAYRLVPAGLLSLDSTGTGLLGVQRGITTVRVVLLTATSAPDTTFEVRVVVARVVLDTTGNLFTRLQDSIEFRATALDAMGSMVPNTAFTWSSSNPSVATVSQQGVVRAVNDGFATIIAEVDSVQDARSVTVAQVASAVSVAPTTDTLRAVTRTAIFAAVTFDSLGRVIPTARPRWSSTDPAVATVDQSGRATATGGGTTTIIATVGQAADTATLVVAQVVRFLFVSPPLDTLTAIEDTGRVTAVAKDSADRLIANPIVTWAGSDNSIVTVNASGLVTAVKNGAAVITATSDRQSAFATVVVRQEVTRVRLTADSVALNGEGDTVRLLVEGFDRNGHPIATADVDQAALTWRSGLDLVATVSTTGLVTAWGDGTTKITVDVADASERRSDTATVSVTGAPQALITFSSERGVEAVRADGTFRSLLIQNLSGVCYDDYYGYYYQCPTAAAADPAWSPDGSRMAFTFVTFPLVTTDEVYSARPNFTDTLNLTRNPADDGNAAWSPDGTKIAFASNRTGRGGVYVMNADGSNVTLVTQVGEYASHRSIHPTWSPDGTRIAYASGCTLFVINADGTDERQLTTEQCPSAPSWSPDGSRLAFVSDIGTLDVWLVNPDGSNPTNLTGSVIPSLLLVEFFPPAWSPDGSEIAFIAGDCEEIDLYYCSYYGRSTLSDVFVIRADGSGLRRLTNTGDLSEQHPAWRPAAPLHWSTGLTPPSVRRIAPRAISPAVRIRDH